MVFVELESTSASESACSNYVTEAANAHQVLKPCFAQTTEVTRINRCFW